MTDEKKVSIMLLCTGLSYDCKSIRFLRLSQEPYDNVDVPDRAESIFKKSTRKKWGGSFPRAGSVYRVDATEDGASIYPATLTFVALWPDQEYRHQRRAESDAYERRIEGMKEAERDDWRNDLAAVRAAYEQAPNAVRVQLLARVVAYVTGTS